MQYAIRGVRAAQVGTAIFFFFGEQLFGSLRRRPPALLAQMHENKLLTAGAVYGMDVIAQTMKSINAFEITYNGHVLHSKLKSGRFPDPGQLIASLQKVMPEQQPAPAAEAAAAAAKDEV